MPNMFDDAFELVIGHEGGYVDNPADPGGETKYGISKRSYPYEDIKSMTLDRAKNIYYMDFWLPLQLNMLPRSLAIMMFDMAINMGKVRATELLQQALEVKIDGRLGPITQGAANKANLRLLLAELTARRLAYYWTLETASTFGLGWTRRSIGTLLSVL